MFLFTNITIVSQISAVTTYQDYIKKCFWCFEFFLLKMGFLAFKKAATANFAFITIFTNFCFPRQISGDKFQAKQKQNTVIKFFHGFAVEKEESHFRHSK